jgi:hypothetical protein
MLPAGSLEAEFQLDAQFFISNTSITFLYCVRLQEVKLFIAASGFITLETSQWSKFGA